MHAWLSGIVLAFAESEGSGSSLPWGRRRIGLLNAFGPYGYKQNSQCPLDHALTITGCSVFFHSKVGFLSEVNRIGGFKNIK